MLCFSVGGVSLKTLFIYCSDDETVNSLCNESAFKTDKTKALPLSRGSGSSFKRYFGVNRVRKYTYGGDYGVDLNDYEKIIIACDEYLGEIPPELSAFISKNDLRYKNIDCIVFGNGRTAKKATDTLKVRVSLSGGTVRNCINISPQEIKREEEDVLFSVRHRLAV